MNEAGDQLRQARESKGLTIADAAKVTCIKPRYLEALEKGQWDNLPGPVQARGFLRSYATFLGLDGDTLVTLAEYETRQKATTQAKPERPIPVVQATAPKPPLAHKAPAFASPTTPAQPPEPMIPPVAVQPIVESPPTHPTPAPPPATNSVPFPSEQAKAGANGQLPEQFALPPWLSLDVVFGVLGIALFVTVAILIGNTFVLPIINRILATPTAARPAVAQAQTATPTVFITPTPVFPVNANGGIQIGLTASEHVWARVTTDGLTAFEGLFTPGQSLTWDAKEQLIVETGNGGAFSVAINGKTMGILGLRDQVTIRSWSPHGEVIPPPTPSPAPPTETPEPAPTLVPTPAPQ